jgi:hypothetical protein
MSFSDLFLTECNLRLCLPTIYVYSVYPAILKSIKQPPNYLTSIDNLADMRSTIFVPEFSLVLNILREGLDFVEAGRQFQGMKLLLYETVLQKGSLKLSPDICCHRL